MPKELPKAYESQNYEDRIYKNWEEQGCFIPSTDPNKDPYVISMPPPNATGTLHLGHAVMLAIEDILTRYNRMQGKAALWVPGTDHASIATQNKVEKLLAEKGQDRHQLGREKFIREVETFVAGSQSTIRNQVRKMGASCDWTRERYTLDAGLSHAVQAQFLKMYQDGLIYRGYRIVNWCPRCASTLADDEVENKDTQAKFYYIKYGPFTIATSRPETKLADTAVAVNPEDKRYKDYIGKEYDIDLAGHTIHIKVIADENVDMEFGTGALGVTPAHSAVDYDMAQKNKLPIIKLIDEAGKITEAGGKYAGLSVKECREKFVSDLEAAGQIEKVEDYTQPLSVCYRCGHTVEPLPSEQWFIDVNKKIENHSPLIPNPNPTLDIKGKSLKELALEVVRSKQINIIPDRFEKTYFHWMENLRDWCISRQIWFGHRIPVWYDADKKPYPAKLQKVIFVRHGEKAVDASGKDFCLSELGRQEATEAGKKLKNENITKIIASSMQRTQETAELINQSLNLEIESTDLCREIWNNEAKELIVTGSEDYKISQTELSRFSSETIEEVIARAKQFLAKLESTETEGDILVVGHSFFFSVVFAVLNGYDTAEKFWQFRETWSMKNCTSRSHFFILPPKGENLKQDEDTLDTWFSSGLWTFSTLGWPDNTIDFQRFHPTACLETGYDILFFWIARMILMTTYAVQDVPFKNVYLHGLVRTRDGSKMSKSKPETCIDPLDMIKKYGADAVRLSLVIGTTPGNDVRLYEEKIQGFRNFVNKIWNIARFALMNVEDLNADQNLNLASLSLADKWILSRLQDLIAKTTDRLESYQLGEPGQEIYEFMWHDFADWYLEVSKEQMNETVIIYVLKNLLKLLHPYAPFVTEALWEEIGQKDLILASWPKPEERFLFPQEEQEFKLLRDIITVIRNLKNTANIAPSKEIKAILHSGDATETVQKDCAIIKKLARLSELEIYTTGEKVSQALSSVVGGVAIYIPLDGTVDLAAEKDRLQKEIANLEKYLSGLKGKLSNAAYVNNAPVQVVEQDRARQKETEEKLAKLQTNLSQIN